MLRELMRASAALTFLAQVGCTTRLVDFTMISTKNVDLTKGASFRRAQSRVEGIDKVSIIIIIPTGTPNMKEAIDRAIESVPGAVALMDGVVTQKLWYIPYIYGESMFIVEGTPLVDPSLAGAKLESAYFIARVDSTGAVATFEPITEAEYRRLSE